MQSSAAPHKTEFRPGDTALATGVYDVEHAEHRATHSAIVLRGEVFPECRTCKDAVRFRLGRSADHISGDSDLGESGTMEPPSPPLKN